MKRFYIGTKLHYKLCGVTSTCACLQSLAVHREVGSPNTEVAVAGVGQHVIELGVPGRAGGALCAPLQLPGSYIIHMHLVALVNHCELVPLTAKIEAPTSHAKVHPSSSPRSSISQLLYKIAFCTSL